MAVPILLLVWHRLLDNTVYDSAESNYEKSVSWYDNDKDLNVYFSRDVRHLITRFDVIDTECIESGQGYIIFEWSEGIYAVDIAISVC